MFGSRRSSIFVRPIVPPEPRENMSDINEGRIPTKIKVFQEAINMTRKMNHEVIKKKNFVL